MPDQAGSRYHLYCFQRGGTVESNMVSQLHQLLVQRRQWHELWAMAR